ncbi:MAG TPA: class I SAM-dependent methyltransferase [Candidatus Binatus sp.]|uniref:class I SAM-dependent methyltransferase n=1 Tax=Candidatus Binatus sp. TaxID=2811406 RepID=UPI002F4262A6
MSDPVAAYRALGRRFSQARMAENYLFRPPYPAEVYDTLLELLRGHPRVLLDAGCGTGKITLGLIDQIDRADAVDPSEPMLGVARTRPEAASEKIRWIRAAIEDAQLDPPYGLIVAASSIHWMDLDRTLPRFAEALADGAMLAVLDGDAPVDAPWGHEASAFMIDFIAAREGQRPKWWKTTRERLAEPVLMHPGFESLGHRVTAPVEFSQSIADYLRCQHSRATWSEDHLGEKPSAEFDAAMTAILNRYARDGMLTFNVQTRIEWGRVTEVRS